jgi:hypothetical protein
MATNNGWDNSTDFLAQGNLGRSNSNPDLFMKFSGKHKVRLVGEPRQVLTAWFNNKTVIVPNDPAMIDRVQDLLEVKVGKNLAINCIDRDDQKTRLAEGKSTRFKILMKGSSVFSPILASYEEARDTQGNKVHPGGPGGSDWMIKVSMKTPGDKRTTQYQVIPVGAAPFTKEEISVIKRADKDGKNPKDEFKDLPLGERGLIDLDMFYNEDKARERLEKLLATVGGGTTATTEETPNVVTSDDSLFGGAETTAPEVKEESKESESLDSLF